MKKLLLLITGLLLLFSVEGQILRYSSYTAPVGADSASWEAEYKAVYYEMTTPPNIDTADIQNTLVKALVDAGVWAKGDLIYVTAQRTNGAGEAYINWINPGTFNLSDPGSTNPSFTVYEGFSGDGSSDYLSTNYDVSNNGINASLNSETVAVYQRASLPDSPTGLQYLITANSFPNYTYIGVDINGGSSFDLFAKCNDADYYLASFGIGSGGRGLFTIVRRGDTDLELYKNGTSVDIDERSFSGSEVTQDFLVLCGNNNGTAENFSIAQISFIYVGGALTDTEVANMNTAVEKYMDAIGKGVQ